MEQMFLTFDDQPQAVIEPNHEKLPFHFHPKLIYAFVPQEIIERFLEKVDHQIIGYFDSVSFNPFIYEIVIAHQKLTLCQAPLGAPAATQLLDWLIAYGVQKILAIGNAGVIADIAENKLLVPSKAIRDEGTSFHYLKPSKLIDFNSNYLNQVKRELTHLKLEYREVITWSTDGFFRETQSKIKQARRLGATTVEMECAALAACSQFRNVEFAQLLFTADTLADPKKYYERRWGKSSYLKAIKIATQILINIE